MTETHGSTAAPERRSHEDRPSLPGRVSLYYRQVVAELRKVIWPTRKQLVTYTTVVLIFVAFVMTIVGLLDLGLAKLAFAVFA